jgi:hypothetical protein
MRPTIDNFEIVRTFGESPTVVCKRANFAPRGYGLYMTCSDCDLRFVCATGGLYDLVGDIENEWVEFTSCGKKSWIRR